MKKLLLIAFAAFSIGLAFTSCSDSDDESTPIIPTDTIPQLKKGQVPYEPIGGDPRGTYFGNTPFVFIIPQMGTIYDTTDSLRTSFYMEIKGNDSTQGTYNYTASAIQYNIALKYRGISSYVYDTISSSTTYTPNRAFSGTWTATGNSITFTGLVPINKGAFSSDENGLFIYKYDSIVQNLAYYYAVHTFKRKP